MKTVTGLFDSYDEAREAVAALETAGVPSSDISIVANEAAADDTTHDDTNEVVEGAGMGAGLGAVVGGTGGLLAGLGMLAIPGIGPVVAAGWLVATVTGAAAGAVVGGAGGSLVGALIDAGISAENANTYAEGVRRGGTLVTARVDDTFETTAQTILNQSSRLSVEDRRRSYADEGWEKFDESAPPYTEDEIRRDRGRFDRS